MEKEQFEECCRPNRENLYRSEEGYLHNLWLSEAKGDLAGMARAYDNLGRTYLRYDNDKAEGMFNKALDINRKLNNKEGMARNYDGLGFLFSDKGEYDKAEDMYVSEMKIHKEFDDEYGLQAVYMNLGDTYRCKREFNKAEENLKKSLAINKKMEKMGKGNFLPYCYLKLGEIYEEQNNKEKAREYLQKAVAMFKKIGKTKFAERIQSKIDKQKKS